MRPLTRMSATSLPCKFLQPIRNRSRRYRMICGGLLLPLRKPGPDGRTLRPLRAWTGFTGLNRPSKPRPEKAALKALATCFHQARNVFAVLISRASTARASVRRRQPGSGMVRCTSGKAPQPASHPRLVLQLFDLFAQRFIAAVCSPERSGLADSRRCCKHLHLQQARHGTSLLSHLRHPSVRGGGGPQGQSHGCGQSSVARGHRPFGNSGP